MRLALFIAAVALATAVGAPGFARGSASAVLARGFRPRASGEPKARPLTSHTARQEEKEMLARFGAGYAVYMKMTWRFIPYVF